MEYAVMVHKKGLNSYTFQWLKHMIRKNGLTLTTPEKADIILVSICDPTETSVIMEAKKYEKPIIMGGQEAFHDKLYSELVDVVVVGEGFEIFLKIKQWDHLKPKNLIARIKELSYCTFKDDKKAIIPINIHRLEKCSYCAGGKE